VHQTFIDCGSGVAGDMLLGALLDIGLPYKELDQMLHRTIRRRQWRLRIASVEREHWPATSLVVEGDRPFGGPREMLAAIASAPLPAAVKSDASAVIRQLQWAEAQAHRNSGGAFDPDGLGLLDTLVDVVGNVWGFQRLGLIPATASAVTTGRLAPASVHLVKRGAIPITGSSGALELATPTGLALLSQLASSFEPIPPSYIEKAGYGAGQKNIPGRPNVLAILRCRATREERFLSDRVLLLETNIDDMDPRLYPHVTELLFKAGALDVWWTPVGMKKGRPGTAFSVLLRPQNEPELVEILFRETTTLGMRRQLLDRWILDRKKLAGRKVARLPGGVLKANPEYEVARLRALQDAVPLKKLLK
jgi:pyridinium-3,5-bisthiocarboxylic acid mononucleotide nickel chelatase